MDPNTWFAQIEQIMQAKKALAKQLEPSEKVDRHVFENMCLKWSIFDPPVSLSPRQSHTPPLAHLPAPNSCPTSPRPVQGQTTTT